MRHVVICALAVAAATVASEAPHTCQSLEAAYHDLECCGPQRPLHTCDAAEISTLDHTGTTLRVVLHEGAVQGDYWEHVVEAFGLHTGADVRVRRLPAPELYGNMMNSDDWDMSIGFANFVTSDSVAKFAAVPDEYRATKPMLAVHPSQRKRCERGDAMYEWCAIDGDSYTLKYRADIFESDTWKAKYKQATGHDLRPPRTWTEHRRITTYFKTQDWNGDGVVGNEIGSLEVTNMDDLGWYAIMYSRLLPSLAHKDRPGQYFFHDLQALEPTFDNEAFRAELQNLKATVPSMPADWSAVGLSQEISGAYGAYGDVLMSNSWDDYTIALAQDNPDTAAKYKVAPMPVTEKVYDKVNRTVSTRGTDERIGINIWGWSHFVRSGSPHKQAAFDLLCYMSNAENRRLALRDGKTGTNPVGISDLHPYDWTYGAQWNPQIAASFAVTKMDTFMFDMQIHAAGVSADSQLPPRLGATLKNFMNGTVTEDEFVESFSATVKELFAGSEASIADLKLNKFFTNAV